MKKYFLIQLLISGLLILPAFVKAQNMRWGSTDSSKHVAYVGAGISYGIAYDVGYGYKIRSNTLLPTFVHIEYSSPSGKTIFDDFKVKIGAQVRLVKIDHFQFTATIDGVFRRYQNDFTRLLNFGSDLSAAAGYYRKKWFIAGEAGFDKAIVTHFKHSAAYKSQYPGAKDGWYEPATGGNFYYGLQTGFTFGRSDITLKAGRIIEQDFKTEPLLPFYGRLGYGFWF